MRFAIISASKSTSNENVWQLFRIYFSNSSLMIWNCVVGTLPTHTHRYLIHSYFSQSENRHELGNNLKATFSVHNWHWCGKQNIYNPKSTCNSWQYSKRCFPRNGGEGKGWMDQNRNVNSPKKEKKFRISVTSYQFCSHVLPNLLVYKRQQTHRSPDEMFVRFKSRKNLHFVEKVAATIRRIKTSCYFQRLIFLTNTNFKCVHNSAWTLYKSCASAGCDGETHVHSTHTHTLKY